MPLGPQTVVVDGQRNVFPSSAQWNPMGWGPQTTGVPQVSPSMPPFLNGATVTGGTFLGGGSGNLDSAIAASNAPFNLKMSAVLWAVILLVVGLMLLKAVHWRETVMEGGSFGPLHEEAHEEA